MIEYQKLKRIQKFSNLVGCFKRFQCGRIEVFLIVIQIIILLLCIMNILIIPHKELNLKPLFGLRIFIIVLLALSLIICSFNKIFRKRKKIYSGYFFVIGFFGSLGCLAFVPINFICVLILTIITNTKVKKPKNGKKYDANSILAIDIFTLLILVGMFFFWYMEVLLVYSKVKDEDSLKEHIETKKRYYESQNEKVVNVINEKFNENNKGSANNNIPGTNNEFEDIESNNKENINEEKHSERSKDDSISNKEEDITHEEK